MTRSTYAELGDACATAHAMELIGGRWSYPIMRELMLGPKRFGELMRSVHGITPAVLSRRLRELNAVGLVETATADSEQLAVYDLTPWARELAPILRELGRWAQSSPVRSDLGGLTPDAVVQAMLTMAEGLRPPQHLRVQLYLVDGRVDAVTEHPYRLDWTRSGLSAVRGHSPVAPSSVHSDSSDWGRVLFTGAPLAATGAIVTGDARLIHSLIDTFRHPLA